MVAAYAAELACVGEQPEETETPEEAEEEEAAQ
jgi:hypothetical protein